MVRFAIIGSGMVARYHATGIAQTPGAELAAVCVSRPARSAAAAATFGAPVTHSLDEILARTDIDAICLCTPSGLHATQAIAALRAGKHVLVEKPMALTLADADAMITAAESAERHLAIALQRRTDPLFIGVQAALARGEYGQLTLGTVTVPYLRPQSYYDQAAWRGTWALDGGGAVMNQGIHLLDLLLWFLGPVAAVQAIATTQARDIEVEDTLCATLRFACGALGSIVATTTAAPGFAHRVEIYGTHGGIQIAGEQVVYDSLAPAPDSVSQQPADAGAGGSPTGISAIGHTRLIADLVDAIGNQRPPLVPGAEGRRSLELVLQLYAAAGVAMIL